MVSINIVSWRSRETERYVVKATSGIFLAGEPGRWYVTSFHFLRAEFGLVCHGAGLAEVGKSSRSRHCRRVCV